MNRDLFLLDGRAYSWRRLCEMRRQQLDARRQVLGEQLRLFDLHKDCRPATQRTAASRYAAPTLFEPNE